MATKVGHFGFVQAVARTDVGKKRKNNEDAFGVFHEAGVFCVADGMGGGDDGEIASAAVVKGIEEGLKSLAYDPDGAYAAADVADVVESSLTKASAWIFNRTRVKKLSGCGSTFVGFVLDATVPGEALAVHAGDSRLYLLHGRSIKQITHDHSVAEMIGAKDESKLNPMFRSMVMNAIGIRAKADPERTSFKIVPGDRILVCSDGLSRMVPDKKILAISRKNAEVAAAADAMIAAALEAGGIDNVTVVLAEVGELPSAISVLPPPEIAHDEDATAEGAERETGLTGGDTSESDDQTMATMMPTMSGESMLAPEESDEESESCGLESKTWQPAVKKRRTKAVVAVTVAGIVLLSTVVLVLVKVLSHSHVDAVEDGQIRQSTVSPQRGDLIEVALPSNSVAANDVSINIVPTETVSREPTETVSREPVVTNEVPSETVVAVASSVVMTNAPSGMATSIESQPIVESVATNAPAKPRASDAVEAVVKACAEEILDPFCQALRRLEGRGNQELAAQMKRFEASAHFCARMRSREGAVRTVVDLRYCLASSAKARKSLGASDRAAVRKLTVWWDALQELEATDDNAMKAAACLMTNIAEAMAR